MTTLEEIVDSIVKKSNYPRSVVAYHAKRIARKFDYELSGKKQNILSKEDAADVESITSRFLQDRKRHESRNNTATQLLAVVPEKTDTKPLPLIARIKRKRLFGTKQK